MKKLIYILITNIFLSFSGFSQESTLLKGTEYQFIDALEYFDKEKYTEAFERFEAVEYKIEDQNSEIKIHAQYYKTLCSYNLFNKDAEFLIKRFLIENNDYPKNNTLKYYLGNIYYRNKDYEQAIAWYNKTDISKIKPKEKSSFYFKRGYAYFNNEELKKAKGDFYENLETDDEFLTPSLYYYSYISYSEKKYQEALVGFEKLKDDKNFGKIIPPYLIQIYFYQRKYDLLISYAEDNLSHLKSKDSKSLYLILADASYNTGNYSKAINYYNKFKKSGNKLTRNEFYKLAKSYYQEKYYKNAINSYSKVINNEEDSLAQLSYYYIADSYLKENNETASKTAFYNAYKLNKNQSISENAFYNYAKLSYKSANYQSSIAIKALQDFIKEYPESPYKSELQTYLVKLYVSSSNYEFALNSLDQIKDKDFRLKKAYQIVAYNRGIELFTQKNYTESINAFEKSQKYPYEKNLNALSKYWISEAYYNNKNFTEAIKSYNLFRETNGAYSTSKYDASAYNLGYVYYTISNYNEAIKWFHNFEASNTKSNKVDSKKLYDTYLRLGDSYYMTKEYKIAISFYDKVISNKENNNLDHANYQQAMCYGFLGENDKKITLLKLIIDNNLNSEYWLDSKYELAETYRSINKNNEALAIYNDIITNHSDFANLNQIMLESSLILYRTGEKEKAKKRLKTLIFSTSGETKKTALDALQQIYINEGLADEFIKWASNENLINYSKPKLDSIQYQSAENLYQNKRYNEAYKKFHQYIIDIENPIFFIEANYFASDCLLKDGDTLDAVMYLENITSFKGNPYTEIAYSQLALIYYNQENYINAEKYYTEVYQIAHNIDKKIDAMLRAMNAAFEAKNYAKTITWANLVKDSKQTTEDEKTDALYLMATCYNNIEDFNNSSILYKEIALRNQGELGYKSKYFEAENYFSLEAINESETTLNELFKRKPSVTYWKVKGYILISDILLTKGDTTQAKITLESIVQNYKGEDLKKIAQEKLNFIIKLEEKEMNLKEESIEIELDDFSKETELFESDTTKNKANNTINDFNTGNNE